MNHRPQIPILIAALGCWLVAACVMVVGIHWNKPLLAVALVLVATALPACAVFGIARRRKLPLDHTLIAATLLCATFAAASAGFAVDAVATGPLVDAARHTSVVIAEATLTSDVRTAQSRQRFGAPLVIADVRVTTIRVHHQLWRCSIPAQLLLSPKSAQHIELGTRVHVVARAAPARAGARSAAYLKVLEPPRIVATPPLWAHIANTWRSGLRKAARSANADATGLLPALAIGDTSLTPSVLADDMRVAGLSHLSAVSGANVSIVLAAVVVLGLLIGIRGRLLAVFAGAVLVWFVVLARPSPSVVRAAVMGAIGLMPLLFGWRRKPGGINGLLALSLATCVLIVLDPWLAISWGFALSFFATLGLIIGSHAVAAWLEQRISGTAFEHVLARIRLWFFSALSVTICAQLAVAPVLVAMGASMSWVAVPANLLAEPVVAPATVFGLASAALSPISPPLAHIAAQPGLWATRWIARVAHTSARIETQHPLSVDPRHFLKSSDKADALAVLCDVGQGTAFVMRVAAHSAFVVDVGPEPALIDDCLHEMGINDIPLLILSHFHSDHVGGLSGALHGRRVGLVLVSPLAAPPQGAHIVTETLRSHGVVAHIASAGERLASGLITVDVLTPTQLLDSVASPPNDDCLAVAITTRVPWRAKPIRVLAPCDLEYAGQEQLLRTNSGLPGNFDIAVVPHHGSSKQLEEFAHWAHPRIALIPVGRHNDYGHPAHTALSLWADRGLTALGRTDTNGDLVISRCGEAVCLPR